MIPSINEVATVTYLYENSRILKLRWLGLQHKTCSIKLSHVRVTFVMKLRISSGMKWNQFAHSLSLLIFIWSGLRLIWRGLRLIWSGLRLIWSGLRLKLRLRLRLSETWGFKWRWWKGENEPCPQHSLQAPNTRQCKTESKKKFLTTPVTSCT